MREVSGQAPGLALLLVGDQTDSGAYVRRKEKLAREAGLEVRATHLPDGVTAAEIMAWVDTCNADPRIHAVLVQLPLPAHVDGRAVVERIRPDKDVDGLHPLNVAQLALGDAGALVPPTAWGVGHLLTHALGDDLAGRRAVVIGRSVLVGRPVAWWLTRADCTVSVAHRHTRDLADLCRQAEILVAAAGQPGLVRGDWVRPQAAVIDVGLTGQVAADGVWRMVGDVAHEEVEAVAGYLTPVPGGVGPMTIAGLLVNTVRLAALHLGQPDPFDGRSFNPAAR